MIKKFITLIFGLLFIIVKKVFIKQNPTPNKLMDNLANKLHSIFIYTSILSLYALQLDKINIQIHIFMFFQLMIITRYYNPLMLKKKYTQIKIIENIGKLSFVIFFINWFVFSFGFAFTFIFVYLLNNILYRFIIDQIEKQKEQTQFKEQFGEGNYTKYDIVKTHILNLFEEDISIENLTQKDVKKQYRKMAKKYHPDVYKGEQKDKFVSINSSYNYLLDKVKAIS
jgi:hypothetical protein